MLLNIFSCACLSSISLMKYFNSLFELDFILFLIFCFESSLCVLDANSLSDTHIANNFYYLIFIFIL